MKQRKSIFVFMLTVFLLSACGPTSSMSTGRAEGDIGPVETEIPEDTNDTQRPDAFTMRMNRHIEIEQSIQKELETGAYTLREPLVIVDPYSEAPLTAVVGFQTTEPTRVDIRILGKDDQTTIAHSFDGYQLNHVIPVYGLYSDALNQVDVQVSDKNNNMDQVDIYIQTESLPEDISTAEIRVKESGKMTEGFTYFDCPHLNGNYEFAIDANGDIRWYLSDKSLNGSVMMAFMENGNLIVSSGNVIPDTYNNLSNVYEITPLGRFIKEYCVYGIHHDIREKKNGNLIMAASKEGRESQNDYIVEVDRGTGEVLEEWDLMEILPMNEYDTQPPYTGNLSNWIHNNGIWFEEDEDFFVISGRHQNMIAKFSASTKELQWVFSETVGERNENLIPYLLQPVGEVFEYPTSQHAPMVLPDGRLLLFDNRNIMDIPQDDEVLDQALLYSRAVIYTIDEENRTVRQDWQYGQNRKDLYSSFVSDVDYLGENHYLINFGGMYVAEDGTHYDHIFTASEVKNAANRCSVVIEILDDEVVFEAVLYGNENSNTYKAERHHIYQNAKELEL